MSEWFDLSAPTLGAVVISTVAIFVTAVFVIRVVGLRSLSKMSSFDFVVTVALGSIVATTAATSTPLWNGMAAFAMLLVVQMAVAWGRRHHNIGQVIDNQPMLLMSGTEFVSENLDKARVTTDDVYAKLREANVTSLDQVLAVVLESTGDISVLHGDGPLEPALLQGVQSHQSDVRKSS